MHQYIKCCKKDRYSGNYMGKLTADYMDHNNTKNPVWYIMWTCIFFEAISSDNINNDS